MFSFNIFLPDIYAEYFDKCPDSSYQLFGFRDRSKDGRTMNIHVTSFICESEINSKDSEHLQRLISKLPDEDVGEDEFTYLGECHSTKYDCDTERHSNFKIRARFSYDSQEKRLQLESFIFNHIDINDLSACSLIFYDIESFMSSQLLLEECQSNDAIEFVKFLIGTLKITSRAHLDRQLKNGPKQAAIDYCSHILIRELAECFVFMTELDDSAYRELTFESTRQEHLKKSSWLFNKSILLPLLKFRSKQIKLCLKAFNDFSHRRMTLTQGNICCGFLFEFMLGIVMMCLCLYCASASRWTRLLVNYMDKMVNDIDQLVILLKSMPAGLKLNRPLNMALSQFFLYHNYLHRIYIDIFRPHLHYLIALTFYSGFFGFTCILSFLSDIFSVITSHIYCLYRYAVMLYGYQISAIFALWRLFRGKKWNKLRKRVDSYSYDNEQLFIGTILFTIFLFLLPTVIMYYAVFLILRILTLGIQEGLLFFVKHISSIPFYSLYLWFFNSRSVAGEIYFENIAELPSQSKSSNPLVLRLCTKSVSFWQIISSCLINKRETDEDSNSEHIGSGGGKRELNWNSFLRNILSGESLEHNLSDGLSLILFFCYVAFIWYFYVLI